MTKAPDLRIIGLVGAPIFALVIPLLGISEDERRMSIDAGTLTPPAMMISPELEPPLARDFERG
jgi:hypothetical protein